MRVKKELINKNVTLIRFVDDKLCIDEFNECFTFKGNYSLNINGYNYYCKSETFYCRGDYALVINNVFIDDAVKMIFKSNLNHRESNLKRLNISVVMAECKLEVLKKEMIKYLKVER